MSLSFQLRRFQRLARPGLQGRWCRQQVEQAAGRSLPLRPGQRRIQAGQLPQPPQGQRLGQLLGSTAQLPRQLTPVGPPAAASPQSLLQGRGPLAQIPQGPGNAHQRATVPQFMGDGAADEGNGETAEARPAAGVEGLDRPQQAQGPHLDEIVEGKPGAGRQAARQLSHQGEVGPHQGIAPAPPPPLVTAGGVFAQPAGIAEMGQHRLPGPV